MPCHLQMPQMYLVVSHMKGNRVLNPPSNWMKQKIHSINQTRKFIKYILPLCISNQATLIQHPTWGRCYAIEVSGIYTAIFMATKVINGSSPIHIHFTPLIRYLDPHYQHLQQVMESRWRYFVKSKRRI